MTRLPQSPHRTDSGTLSGRLGTIAFNVGVVGFVGLLVGAFVWNHYFARPVADGPQERALVAAIRSRDVSAARAAIAAGASLTAPLPVVEDSFESRRQGGRQYHSTVWVIVREMVGMTFTGPGGEDRAKLVEIARAIFEAGGDPNASVSVSRGRKHYLIEDAVSYGDGELIQVMVDAGLDVRGEGAGSALLSACYVERDDVALTLIRAGANVNYRSRTGETPLAAAVSSRRVALIDALKRAGASESGEGPR